MKRIISLALTAVMLLSTCVIGISTASAADVQLESTGANTQFTAEAECIPVLRNIEDNIFYRMDGTTCKLTDEVFRSELMVSSFPISYQGSCAVGEDIFYAVTYETDTTKTLLEPDGYILKYKASEDRWYISEGLPIYHTNTLAYHEGYDAIVVSHCYVKGSQVTFIDPETLTVRTDLFSNGVATAYTNSSKTSTIGFHCIGYDSVYDRYFIAAGTGHYVLNSDFVAQKTWLHSEYNNNDIEGWVTQGIHVDENYAYIPYSESGTTTYNRLIIRDWNDAVVTEVKLPVSAEIEDVFTIGNQFYAAFQLVSGSVRDQRIYKINFINSNVSYNANGGSGSMASTTLLHSENSKLTPNAFTKSGYAFDGWTATNSSGQKLYTNGSERIWCYEGNEPEGYELCVLADGSVFDWHTTNTDSYTLNAQWKKLNSDYFSINYIINKNDTNASSGTMPTSYANCGEKVYLAANAFAYNRHHLEGWHAEQNGKWLYKTPSGLQWLTEAEAGSYEKKLFADGEKASIPAVAGQVNLYAKWDVSTFTIKFDANGGKGFSTDLISKNGTATQLPACTMTKKGYKCSGYNAYKPSSNTWFYGNSNGGWLTEAQATAAGLTDADRSLYKLTAKVSDTSWLDGEIVYFYAQWTPITFTIKYHPNGGSGTLEDTVHTYGVSQKTANAVDVFKRSGYTLEGFKLHRKSDNSWYYHNPTDNTNKWVKEGYLVPEGYTEYKLYNKKGSTVSATSTTDGDVITFYAVWTQDTGTAEKFTVRYHANGGEGTMNETVVTIGTGKNLAANTFTREGYTFSGWIAYRTGIETSGNSWLFWNKQSDGTYYGGSYDDQWVAVGKLPTKTGITGLKIYNDKAKISATGVDGQVVSLYAQWTPINANVTYDANGGEGYMSGQTVDYDGHSRLLDNQFRTGSKKFVGWTAFRQSDSTYYCVNKLDRADKKWLAEADMGVYYEKYIFSNKEGVQKLSPTAGDTITFIAQWKQWGDPASDGAVTVADVSSIQKFAAKIHEYDDEQMLVADVNGDGKVNTRDALCIQKYIAKITSYLPVCQ